VDRVAGLNPLWLLGAAFLVFLALSAAEMGGESCTYDEGANLAAGWSYLSRGDFRMNPEHPPLAKMVSALPFLALRPTLPEDSQVWSACKAFDFGFLFLYQSGNDADRLLFWARLPTLLWSLALIVSVYVAARDLYGPRGALLSLAVAALCPTLLAHGHLATNDVAVSVLSFLTVLSFRRFLRGWSLPEAAACGALLACSLLTKFSAVFLVPILLALAAGTLLRRPGARSGEESGTPSGRLSARVRPVVGFFVLGAVAYILVWACYLFRYEASPDKSFAFRWDFPTFNESMGGAAVTFAREHRLLPEAFLQGLAVMSESATLRQSYALGLHSLEGWWWYFPFAFLVKTPVPSLILMGWGLTRAVRRYARGATAEEYVILSTIVFWILCMRSNVDIGIRLLLPVHPFLFVAAGGVGAAVGETRETAREAIALPALLGGVLLSALWGAPCFLAYFNLPSRAIAEPCYLLSDSNLDWGQDLGRLKRYMDQHGIDEIKMAYHGSASPRQLRLRHQILPGLTWYTQYLRHEPEWKQAADVRPGDYVAVGAASLVGLVLEDRNLFLKQFGGMEPVARIGGSILLYKIP
jgi:hypothetical protein